MIKETKSQLPSYLTDFLLFFIFSFFLYFISPSNPTSTYSFNSNHTYFSNSTEISPKNQILSIAKASQSNTSHSKSAQVLKISFEKYAHSYANILSKQSFLKFRKLQNPLLLFLTIIVYQISPLVDTFSLNGNYLQISDFQYFSLLETSKGWQVFSFLNSIPARV